MPQPNFAIIGAPKCGTTSLARWLESHPAVYLTDPKEPFFFADDFPGLRALQGVSDATSYSRLFDRARPCHVAVGEASSLYLSSRGAVKKFVEFAADPILIVLLRNPVDIAQSFHGQMALQGFDLRTFSDAWAERRSPRLTGPTGRCPDSSLIEYHSIASIGSQLSLVRDQIGLDRVRFVVFEDLKADPAGTFAQVTSWLGVPNREVDFMAHNGARRARGPLPGLLRRPGFRRATRGVKRALPGRIVSKLRTTRDRMLYADITRPVPDAQLASDLRSEFRDEVRLLEEVTGLPLGQRWGYSKC
ncbi:sulfotransferase family protein [Mycolicibacterium elephantis]